MSQNALDIAKKNDENRLFSFTYLYPIIMSIGKILCYIRVYSIHISQKTFNFAAENDNNIPQFGIKKRGWKFGSLQYFSYLCR